jgi:sialate O-acetylesterase
VAFFFARQLNEKLGVPVGIIQSSFGGTPAESWTSAEVLSKDPQFQQAMEADLAKLDKIAADPVESQNPKRFTLPFAAASGLFNAMINPVIPYSIRGVIWYQGESNAFRAEQYSRLLPVMIADWRARFGQGDFPFYLVQLANYYDPAKEPPATDKRSTDDWVARLREAQFQVVQTVPETGMAVAIDVGKRASTR